MPDSNNQYQMMETQGYVVQSNKLIQSRQKLNWVEAKLVRLAIMQVLKNDKKFDAYKIPIKTFCELLNIDLDLYCGKNAKKYVMALPESRYRYNVEKIGRLSLGCHFVSIKAKREMLQKVRLQLS